MSPIKICIEGIQKEQRRNLKALARLEPRNVPAKAVQYVIAGAARYAISIIHVRTGALKAAQTVGYFNFRGVLFVEAGAMNPVGQRPARYGAIEHARGGDHAFYHRTVAERGEQLLRGGQNIIAREIFND